MQEKKDLIKTHNDETGVEESHLSLIRVIGNKIYTAKQTITDDGAGCGEEMEEMFQTNMNMDCNCDSDCECDLQNFKNDWEEKWNPSIQEDEPGILTSGDAVTSIEEKASSYETDDLKFQLRVGRKVKSITNESEILDESAKKSPANVREYFEISKEDPKYMICTICGSRLSKGSKETTFQKHLETKKHLKELNSKNRLKLKASPKSTKMTPAKATTPKSAQKTPAKAATSEDEPGIFARFSMLNPFN